MSRMKKNWVGGQRDEDMTRTLMRTLRENLIMKNHM